MPNGKDTRGEGLDEAPPVTAKAFAALVARVEYNIALHERQSAEQEQLKVASQAQGAAQTIMAATLARVEEQIATLTKLVTETTSRVSARESTNEQVVLDAARAHLAVQRAVQEAKLDDTKADKATKRELVVKAVPYVLSIVAVVVTGYLAARGLIAPATPTPPATPPVIQLERGPSP